MVLRRLVVALAVSAALAGAIAPPAGADVGVAVTTGAVTLDAPVVQGKSYALPQVGVRNPGDEPANYVLDVSDIDGDAFLGADATWFTFSPARLRLNPGESQLVKVQINVPTGAAVGDYQVLVKAVLATDAQGASVGAAAASRLTFHVDRNSGFLTTLVGFVANPLALAVVALMVVWAAARTLRRRFSFSLVRKPN